MYFVNSMSDWLHENVNLDYLDAAFDICEQSPLPLASFFIGSLTITRIPGWHCQRQSG